MTDKNGENNKPKLFVNVNPNNESESNNPKILINSKMDLSKIPISTIIHENLLNFEGEYFKKLYEEAEEEEKKELMNENVIEEETFPIPNVTNNNQENNVTESLSKEEQNQKNEENVNIKQNKEKKVINKNKMSKSKKEIKKNSKSDNAIKEVKPKKKNLLNNPNNNPIKQTPINKVFKINKIYFEMKYDTQMGENLAVIGSIDKLGNWDTGRSLNLNWNEGNIWVASFDYNEINDFEYKFIFVDNGYVKEWENGINRKFIFQQIKSLIEPNLVSGNIIRLKNIMDQSLEYDYNNYSLKIISEWNKK